MYSVNKGKWLLLKQIGAVLFTCLLLGTIGASYLFITRKYERQELKDLTVEEKFGTLWFGMDTTVFKAAHYSTVFLIRRMIFAMFSVYLGQVSGGLIIIAVLYIGLAQQVFYLLPVSPNTEKKD